MIIIVVCIIRALSGIPAYIYPRKFISVLVLPSQTQLENLISCFNQNTHPTVEENRSSRWSAWFYPWRPPHQRWIPGSCCMASGASCTPLQWFFLILYTETFFLTNWWGCLAWVRPIATKIQESRYWRPLLGVSKRWATFLEIHYNSFFGGGCNHQFKLKLLLSTYDFSFIILGIKDFFYICIFP